MRWRRWEKWAAGVFGAVVAIVLIAILLITQTDWGRRHVLAIGLNQLASRVHGKVTVGRLEGNLLSGATLIDVTIVDTAGRPFLRADTLALRYSLSSLLRQHLILSDVVLANASVVIDQPPGEEWNFSRLFPTTPKQPNRGPGFGSWIVINDMTVRNTDVLVRSTWKPPAGLAGSALEQKIASDRQRIVPVQGGYQALAQFTRVNAQLPLLRLADPDSANRFISIRSLNMIAQPFRPPGGIVRNLAARTVITKDSILFDSVRFVLPGTRGNGLGAYALNGSGARVQIGFNSVNFEDLRFIDPTVPSGSGKLSLAFTSHRGRTHVIASNMDLRAEGATIRGLADLYLGGGTFSLGPSNVSLANLDSRVLKRYVPRAPINTVGTLAGHMQLRGSQASMDVDGWTTFDERNGPTSRIVADGRLGTSGGAFVARGLRLRFEPLHLSLVRSYARGLPYRGAVRGTATLTGTSSSGFAVVADLVDDDPYAGHSRILANGRIEPRDGFTARNLRLRFAPLQVAMLKQFAPDLPYNGTISGTTTLTGSPKRGFSIVADVTHVDPKFGRSHVGANGRIGFGGEVTADHLRLRFDPVQVQLASPFVKNLPYGGTITGTTTLTGSRRRGFDIDADVTHNSVQTGRSHVTADGWVGFVNGVTTRAMRLGFAPLQIAAIKPFARNLPLDGTLSGRATVSTALASKRIRAVVDLEHAGSTGSSHVIGDVAANWAGRGAFDIDVRAPALSLATIGAFAPAAGLRGQASGTIVARGTLADLQGDLTLAFRDGGTIRTHGVFDLSAPVKRYDFRSTFVAFNAAAATTHAPQTMLNGTLDARGAGLDLATATATINANLTGSRAAGSPLVDTALVQARLASGLAIFDRGHIRLGSARADVSGSFGLIATQNGTLTYDIAVDTLSQFAAHIPVDTGTIYPRPMLQARRIAQAREDSARIAQATEVQRAAVGYPPPPALQPDTLPFRRDTLAGRLHARGTLAGNIRRFDTRGDAQASHLSLGANYIGRGAATYAITGFGTPTMTANIVASGDTLHLGGFAFDSAGAKVTYGGTRTAGRGNADIALFQDPARDYRAVSDFTIALDRNQLALQNLTLRFDTTFWRSQQPAQIAWGKQGITVENFDLRNNVGGRIALAGRLPTNGAGDLRLDIERLQVGDISGLLQDTGSVQGILGLHARIQGTGAAPVVTGTASLAEAVMDGKRLPDINADIAYADRQLTSHAELLRNNGRVAVADARIPINLAITGVTGPRLLRSLPLQVDIRADSLPLDALPSFTTAVTDVRGRVRGDIRVRGTFDNPDINGDAFVDLGSVRIASTGVIYNDINGAIRLQGRTAHVDSLVAHNGGPIRATGTIDFETLARPSFNLNVLARDALVLDNERGRVTADANFSVTGPFTGVEVNGAATITSGTIYAPETKNYRATNLQDPTLLQTIDTAAIGLRVLPPPNPLMQNLTVNVALRVLPDTWIRNTKMNVEIYTPDDSEPLRVHMDNAHQVLTISGTINTDRGEYTVVGRNFQLTTGSVTFLGGPTLDPLLQLTANYQVQRRGLEALTIQIHVNGSLRAPRVTLQSNAQPPLAQSDLLSYLAFGQSSSSLLNFGTSPALSVGNGGLSGIPALAEQQLASLAIGAVVDEAVNEIEKEGSRSGLDVFRVHAGELPAEAAFESSFTNFFRGTEVVAGKYISKSLFLEARGRASTWPGLALNYRDRFGLMWRGVWEPRYLPVEPSLSSSLTAQRTRSLGALLLWSRRF